MKVAHIHGTALRLRDTLLHGHAQQQTLRETGAVAGTIGADGVVRYVYGAATGYYLHWLASLDESGMENCIRAAAAVEWLEQYLQDDTLPPTRIYLTPAVPDWRNHALFAFDLAMIAGGVARATTHDLITLPAPLVADLLFWLQRFVTDGRLDACIARDSTAVLPERWSTRGGSFSAKTASRILQLAALTTVDDELVGACRQTLAGCARATDDNDLDMLHPTLYALEGCLLSADADPERLARWFDRIVALQATDGSLPEAAEATAIRRSDIIAQALRIAVFLQRKLAQPTRYREACAKFAAALCSRTSAEGTLAFTPDTGDANIWCAMFAEQALRLHVAELREQDLPFAVEDLV
jgi:hypothetical protein